MSGVSKAGIETTADGASYIPSSKRPDGSTRKEIRVRPGYRPPKTSRPTRTGVQRHGKPEGVAGSQVQILLPPPKTKVPQRIKTPSVVRRLVRKLRRSSPRRMASPMPCRIPHLLTKKRGNKTGEIPQNWLAARKDPQMRKQRINRRNYETK